MRRGPEHSSRHLDCLDLRVVGGAPRIHVAAVTQDKTYTWWVPEFRGSLWQPGYGGPPGTIDIHAPRCTRPLRVPREVWAGFIYDLHTVVATPKPMTALDWAIEDSLQRYRRAAQNNA